MTYHSSFNQRLRKTGYLIGGMSLLMIAGYAYSFSRINFAKNQYQRSVSCVVAMSQLRARIQDLTLAVQGIVQNSIGLTTGLERAKAAVTDVKGLLAEIGTVDPSSETQAFVVRSNAVINKRLVQVLDKLKNQAEEGKTETQLSQLYETEFASARTVLEEGILETETRKAKEALSFADYQNSVVRLGFGIMGVLLILGILGVTVFIYGTYRKVFRVLNGLVNHLSGSIRSVQQAIGGIASASRLVSSSATEHASAVEETAASMEEMTAMVAHSSSNAVNSLNVARDSQREVDKGKEILHQMNTSMHEIQMANTKLSAILQIIEHIRNKTKIINDIVFETRLLSFNASIEAARAGIHGKGFAVVAEEVGKLASLSGKAADEIRTLLDSSVSEVNLIVGTTHEKVSTAKQVSEQSEAAFYKMAEAMRQIADAMDGITTASSQQELGIRETNKAMMDISRVTQRNSTAAEKMLVQVSSLDDLVQSLTGWVENLRGFLYGSSEPSGHRGDSETPPLDLERSDQQQSQGGAQVIYGNFGEKAPGKRTGTAVGPNDPGLESPDRKPNSKTGKGAERPSRNDSRWKQVG